MCVCDSVVSLPALATQVEACKGIFGDSSAKESPISIRYRTGVNK